MILAAFTLGILGIAIAVLVILAILWFVRHI